MVFVNGVGAEGVELPFGGIKRSGFGRELGRFGMDEFVNKKMIVTRPMKIGYKASAEQFAPRKLVGMRCLPTSWESTP